MIRLLFSEVRVTPEAATPVLVLKEADGPRHLAVWISATKVGDVVRSPINQAAATVWKNVPMLEPSCAAKSAAKTW